MKANFILMSVVFGVIAADYVGPQNGNKNGNGNGNSYGVPPDSITPPQPQGGPYPPSGWKPSGRRLLLPGESRSAQQPIDSGYGQPPPPQYGPINPSPSGPSIDSQYGPSVDNTGSPNNQYIPGTGFGNGANGGNGFTNGNGGNGGNGHSSGNGNGNGQTEGNGNGNGHTNNGNGHGSNKNGANGGNGNLNGGNGNKFSNGNGQNGSNGAGNGNKGSNGSNGSNGFAPEFHGAFPGGVIYPFVQHSVPAVLAFRPRNGASHGSIYPIYQVPISPSTPATGIIASSFPAEHGVFSFVGANPSFQVVPESTNLGPIYPNFQITGSNDIASSHHPVLGQGTGLISHGTGSYYLLSLNHQSQNSNILGAKNGFSNLQLQHTLSNAAYGNGVPLGAFR